MAKKREQVDGEELLRRIKMKLDIVDDYVLSQVGTLVLGREVEMLDDDKFTIAD